MTSESVKRSSQERAARELAAAEAALAALIASPTRDWSLVAAALQVGRTALVETPTFPQLGTSVSKCGTGRQLSPDQSPLEATSSMTWQSTT